MIDIPGYEGLYAITEEGRVWSYPKKGIGLNHNGKFLKVYEDDKGYLKVILRKDSKAFNYQLHRLVAIAFIPNPEDKPQVNHIDGNKQNNCASNLEWVTLSENQKHAFKIGLQKGKKSKDNPMARSVKCINNNYIFNTIREAGKWCNADESCIIRVCKKSLNRLGNQCLTAGKHPITKEKLRWEYA